MNGFVVNSTIATKNETFFDLLENLIVCKFDKKNFHLLHKPVILPCGYTVCKECVQDSILRFGFIKCDFPKCSLKHEDILSVNYLNVNKAVDDILENNLKYLSEFYIEKLRNSIESRQESPNPARNEIGKVFKKLEQDIKKRAKKIRSEIDRVEADLLNLVKKSKKSFYKDQQKSFDTKKQSTLKLINLTQNLLKQNSTSTAMLKAYTSKCYSCIKEINDLKHKFKISFKSIKFEASKWLPTKLNIGNLIIPNVNYSNRDSILISNEISNVNYYLQNVHSLPKIIFKENEKFDKNNYIYNEKCFSLINDLETLTNETKILSKQYGICYDNIENIYLCDFNRGCVLIIDKEFTKIKKIVSKTATNDEKKQEAVEINKIRPLNFRYIQTLFI